MVEVTFTLMVGVYNLWYIFHIQNGHPTIIIIGMGRDRSNLRVHFLFGSLQIPILSRPTIPRAQVSIPLFKKETRNTSFWSRLSAINLFYPAPWSSTANVVGFLDDATMGSGMARALEPGAILYRPLKFIRSFILPPFAWRQRTAGSISPRTLRNIVEHCRAFRGIASIA